MEGSSRRRGALFFWRLNKLGFESCNLRRMVKCAQAFPDAAIVSTLSAQLSWSHLVAVVALKSPETRAF